MSYFTTKDGTSIYYKDWEKIDVPTLILHGEDDQIVPIADSALLAANIVKGAKLVVVKGASHGLCTVDKDRVNAELLEFIGATAGSKTSRRQSIAAD